MQPETEAEELSGTQDKDWKTTENKVILTNHHLQWRCHEVVIINPEPSTTFEDWIAIPKNPKFTELTHRQRASHPTQAEGGEGWTHTLGCSWTIQKWIHWHVRMVTERVLFGCRVVHFIHLLFLKSCFAHRVFQHLSQNHWEKSISKFL